MFVEILEYGWRGYSRKHWGPLAASEQWPDGEIVEGQTPINSETYMEWLLIYIIFEHQSKEHICYACSWKYFYQEHCVFWVLEWPLTTAASTSHKIRALWEVIGPFSFKNHQRLFDKNRCCAKFGSTHTIDKCIPTILNHISQPHKSASCHMQGKAIRNSQWV